MRKTVFALLGGLQAALSSMVVRYEFCMAGDGFGFPLAIIHPGHDEWWLLPPGSNDSRALDILGLATNWMFFAVLIAALFWWGGYKARAQRG